MHSGNCILHKPKFFSRRRKNAKCETVPCAGCNFPAARVSGFTIIEVIIAVAIFAILAAGSLGAIAALTQSVKVARQKTELASLVAADLEVVRNLPYIQIGTVNGNPAGSLPDEVNPKTVVIEGRSYQIYYEVTYFDDPADGLVPVDTAAADYKQVKMFIKNMATGSITSILTNIAPKGLEGTTNAGALLIKVFNAQGQPVSNASVQITNTALTPNILLNRQTDSQGVWTEVGLPASANGYHVVVTKTGYSTDQTYPITAQNPNPIKPDATVVVGQVTQVSFAIDVLANLTIRTLDQKCQPVNNVGVNVAGSKLIGTNPNVLKFDQNFTSSSGQILLNNIEWDTYTPTLLAAQGLMVYGTSPIQQIDVLPGTSQTFTLIVGAQTTNSLLVIVKDAATGAALEGAQVHLQKGGSNAQDYYGITGGSVLNQLDWTGGSGQVEFTNSTQYFQDDGGVDINSVPTGLQLKKVSGRYVASGVLESSTFDTGADTTNYTTISWSPNSQTPAASLKFQLASNNDNATWNFVGPDGTSSTYYTASGTNIASVHDNTRYMRYKAYLSTADDKETPVLTNINLNYVSGCFSPGQSVFTNLTQGNNYTADVQLAGYQTETLSSFSISGNQILEVLLSK